MSGRRRPAGMGNWPVPTGNARRLVYFPEAFPEEIMYSVFARCLRHLGTPGREYMSTLLFGVARRKPNINSSSGLGFLEAGLPKTYALDARTMLFEHTNFPYYAVFMQEAQKEAAIAARVDPRSSTSVSGNGWKRSARMAGKEPRFCPDCLLSMQERHGELYWRRDHQIPTVLVCPVHGSVLRKASTASVPKGGFCPATPATCPSNAPTVFEGMTERERETLHAIAVRSAALLQRDATIVSKATDLDRFRRAMGVKGLLHGLVLTKTQALNGALLAEFGHLERVWPDVFKKTGARGSGALERVAGAGAEIHDPLLHILLAILLDRLPDVPEPFGTGPWMCPNPLASHTSESPVREVSFDRTHTPLITAQFTCECGYVYTRTAHPDGRVTDPKYKSFGSTLRPLLIEAIAGGWALHRTAAAAGISDRALRTQVAAFGFADPWPKGRDWRGDRRRRQSSSPPS